VVNLAAGEGHPAAVMDVSFALQALATEHLARDGETLEARVLDVPRGLDEEVARLKLAAFGLQIDAPTEEQLDYRQSWLPD
jgi:adenosylhomocysteinase